MIQELRALPTGTYLRALGYATIAALAIGIPTDLIDTRFFGRPIEATAIDYIILIITSALMGLVFAIRMPPEAEAVTAGDMDRSENRSYWGAAVSFFAVGCPVCNQFVVGLVGTSGALSWWAPVQPFVGALAVALIIWALRMRLRTYQLAACPLPAAKVASNA